MLYRSSVGAILAVVGFLNCFPAGASPLPLLTPHVPDAVAGHQAAFLGALPPHRIIELAISLPLHDPARRRDLLARLYDPASSEFRHYLSVNEFTARFCPSGKDYAELRKFAEKSRLHIRNETANRRVLDVFGQAADVEQAFNIRIGLYQHPTENRIFMAPDREPNADLALPILHVSGLDDFPLPFTHWGRGRPSGAAADVAHRLHTGSGPDGNFIDGDVRRAYYSGYVLDGAGQSLGLLEYKGHNLADVENYFARVGQPLNVPVVGVSLNGARLNCRGGCDDSEQVLDMQEAISMAPGLAQIVVFVGHTDVSILNQMAVDDTSKQLSSSWGWHPDPEVTDPIFEEFAAKGQSFVDATGDYGYQLKKGAVWPADDRNVTAIGGTDLVTKGPGLASKRESGWVYGGGGSSPDGIAIPGYQLPFVARANGASATLRNVPDIAGDANTNNFSCYDGGCSIGNGGTSYAAPLWAGHIALANQRAAQAGKPPIGSLNPTLYSLGGRPFYK